MRTRRRFAVSLVLGCLLGVPLAARAETGGTGAAMTEAARLLVASFDEAQRAWSLEQTAAFMKRKKGIAEFSQSEPEFLISCLDRHRDWAVIVCLIGGGQEINTGEAGIGEWARALCESFPHWKVFSSDRLLDAEYGAGAGPRAPACGRAGRAPSRPVRSARS